MSIIGGRTSGPTVERVCLLATGLVLGAIVATTSRDIRSTVAGEGSLLAATLFGLVVAWLRKRQSLVALCTVLGMAAAAAAALTTTDMKAWGVAPDVLAPALLSSPFGAPVSANTLAFLILPEPFAAFALARAERTRRATWTLLAIEGAALILWTGSRAALAGLLAGAFCVAVATWGYKRWKLLIPAAVAAGAAMLGETLGAPPGDAVASTIIRLDVWRQIWEHFDLLTGAGFGGFAAVQTASPQVLLAGSVPLTAHNVYLQTLLDFGVAGSFPLAALFVLSQWRAWTNARARGESRFVTAIVSGAGGVALAVTGMFESVFSMSWIPTPGSYPLTTVSPLVLVVLGAALGYRSDDA